MAKETKQKGKLPMDPMVEPLWRSKHYLVPAKETISLVRKIVEMLGTTLGGFVPETTGVGQMKLYTHCNMLEKGNQGSESGEPRWIIANATPRPIGWT